MILLSGADLVLPDRVLAGASLALDGDRIADLGAHVTASADAVRFHFADHYIVPGFIDVHVHGIEGTDASARGRACAAGAPREQFHQSGIQGRAACCLSSPGAASERACHGGRGIGSSA
jgi:N-acetylglucosamine-6-phosphate deacetylase